MLVRCNSLTGQYWYQVGSSKDAFAACFTMQAVSDHNTAYALTVGRVGMASMQDAVDTT
jgi:hypothetical protein